MSCFPLPKTTTVSFPPLSSVFVASSILCQRVYALYTASRTALDFLPGGEVAATEGAGAGAGGIHWQL